MTSPPVHYSDCFNVIIAALVWRWKEETIDGAFATIIFGHVSTALVSEIDKLIWHYQLNWLYITRCDNDNGIASFNNSGTPKQTRTNQIYIS